MKLSHIMLTALLFMLPATISAHESATATKNTVSVEKTPAAQASDANAINKESTHSGRTNSDGCHNDRIHGGYHCH